MKKIYFGTLGYSLFLFLLINNKSKDLKFILPYFVRDTYPVILKNLIENFKDVIVLPKKPSLKNIISYLKYEVYLKKILSNFKESKVEIYGHSEASCFFLSNQSIILELEEGTANYLKDGFFLKDSLKNKIYFKIEKIIFRVIFRKRLFNYKEWLEKIDKFYATEKMPKDYQANFEIEKINIIDLWNKIENKKKLEILKIFGIKLESLKDIKEKEMVLFTQPLSEDGYLTEEEKINLYKKIIIKYPKEKIVIKPHPRERTKYKEIFNGYLIIEENYPVEILKCLEFNPKKVITIFSSSVLGFEKDVKIDFYGTEIHPTLFERFGTQDKIIKRNAFLN